MDRFLTTLYSLYFSAKSELEELNNINAFPADGSYQDVHKEKTRHSQWKVQLYEDLIEEYMATNYLRGRVGKPQ
jgi:hypothetical protein